MNFLKIEDLKEDKYSVNVEDYDNTIQLKFKGIIDTRYPNKILNPFFLKLDKIVTQQKLKIIYCDILGLDFINSHAITCIFNWVVHVASKPLSDQYKLYFILDKNEIWQKTSLTGLFKLYMSLVHFEYREK